MLMFDWITENGDKQSEGYKQAPGLSALLDKRSNLFGMKLCLQLFAPIEKFSKELQSKSITLQQVVSANDSIIRYYTEMRFFKLNTAPQHVLDPVWS